MRALHGLRPCRVALIHRAAQASSDAARSSAAEAGRPSRAARARRSSRSASSGRPVCERELGERDVAAGELVRRAHAAPQVDRVLELRLGRRRVAAGAGEQPAREAQRRAQRRGAGRLGELLQLVDAGLGGAGVSEREVHADRQLEAGRAAQTLAGRQRAQVTGDEIARARRVAAVEGDLGEAELRGGMPRDPLAQLRGLVEAALAPAQLGQANDALEDQCRRALREGTRGGLQLGLGFGPPAAPDQHRRVVGAAEAEQLRHAPLLGEALHRLAPLRGPLGVVDALAGVDHVAADGSGEMQPGQLARHRGGRRLVELAHAFADLSGRDPRETGERERQHLQIHDADAPADLQRAGRVLRRSRASPCATSATSPSRNASHPCSSPSSASSEQPVGMAEPALRDGVVAPEHDRVVGEPCRGAGRRACIAAARDRRGTRGPARPGSRRRRPGSARPGPSPRSASACSPSASARSNAALASSHAPRPALRVPRRGCAGRRRRDERGRRRSSSDGSWLRISPCSSRSSSDGSRPRSSCSLRRKSS